MSHICGCINPCNCLVEEDGLYAVRPQDGRRNTVVSGTGTPANPIVIEFQHSEFYRPPAGEVRVFDKTIPSAVTPGNAVGPSEGDTLVTIYQTPTTVFSVVALPFTEAITSTKGHFHVVGASARFAANAGGSQRRIGIIGLPPDPAVISDDLLLAAQEGLGNAGRDTVLTCTGFSPGLLIPPSPLSPNVSDTRIDLWAVGVNQDSGGPLLIEEIKFWMVTV